MRKLIILAMLFVVAAGAEAQGVRPGTTGMPGVTPVLKLDGAPLPNATVVKFVASREAMGAKQSATLAFSSPALFDEKLEGRFFRGLSGKVSVDLIDQRSNSVRNYGAFVCFLSSVEWGSSTALATWTLSCSPDEKP